MDYASTTPVHPAVVEAMKPYGEDFFGNPSNLHMFGQQAREAIENSRDTISNAIKALPEELIFTSSGTEADCLAIIGFARANKSRGDHILLSSIEHPAVLNSGKKLQEEGFEINLLPVGSDGIIDPQDVNKAIRKNTILASIMHVNNEIGTIQPIREISSILKEKEICFHVDAVQSFPFIPINVDDLGVDMLTLSAHKIYGPKGVGLLYIRQGIKIEPLLWGGKQEKGLRAGTENVAGIVGFAKAVMLTQSNREEESLRLKKLRDQLIISLTENIDHCQLIGHPQQRVPNNASFIFDMLEGESLMIHLDREGIACSTGAACASATTEPSHVLLAMGMSYHQAQSFLRFTLGRYNTEEDIKTLKKVMKKIVVKLRSISAAGRFA